MKIAELKKLLKAGEWNDVEFKEARSAVPKSAFETVSAFANTHGGWLVFGVSQHDEGFDISGVEKADKVQNDFLSVLHADAKINHDVQVTEQKLDIDGKSILIFQISENPRTRKPVYLDGDIRRTFLRKGSGDYKAQMQDIERMLRDAGVDRWDSQPFDRVPFKDAFHSGSLRWYRDRFHQVNSGFDPNQSDRDFLYHWGFLLRHGKGYLPTRAAILLNDRSGKAFEFFIPELDKEVDMASDLMKSMFGEAMEVSDKYPTSYPGRSLCLAIRCESSFKSRASKELWFSKSRAFYGCGFEASSQ